MVKNNKTQSTTHKHVVPSHHHIVTRHHHTVIRHHHTVIRHRHTATHHHLIVNRFVTQQAMARHFLPFQTLRHLFQPKSPMLSLIRIDTVAVPVSVLAIQTMLIISTILIIIQAIIIILNQVANDF